MEQGTNENRYSRVVTQVEFLRIFHNEHLKQMIANQVTVKLVEGLIEEHGENYKIEEVPIQMPGNPQPVMRPITARNKHQQYSKQLKDQKDILKIIRSMLQGLGEKLPEELVL